MEFFLAKTAYSHAAAAFPGVAAAGGAIADEAWRFTPLELRQLDELARLRGIGMANAERLAGWLDGKLTEGQTDALIGKGGIVDEFANQFARISRAVRQIIALEREIAGLCDGPDRLAERMTRNAVAAIRGLPGPPVWSDRRDYDNGPLDRVVAKVRKALGVDAPEDDPFAPPAARRTRVEPAAEAADDRPGGDPSEALNEISDQSESADAVVPACGFVAGSAACEIGGAIFDDAGDARSRGPPF